MSGHAITTLTGATFEQMVLQGEGPIAVEFMSYSCAYCAALEPVLQQAAGMLAAQERIFRINIGNDEDLAESFGITGTPTIVLFQNGSEVGRVDGPEPDLNAILAELTQPFAA
jgi:thioredoxin-like negative regulator of GroEL